MNRSMAPKLKVKKIRSLKRKLVTFGWVKTHPLRQMQTIPIARVNFFLVFITAWLRIL